MKSMETQTAFAYEAQSPGGQTLRGTLQAASAEEVHAQLGALQLRVMAVAPAPAEKRHVPGLGADDFIIFNQQLAHLTDAGLPVERGLRLIAIDLHSGKLAVAARNVAGELERGLPLQEAFARHAALFPPLYGKLVEAGAKTGNLSGMLFNLGRHLELVGRLRRSLWRTLAYPLMVFAALSLVFLFISLYVLPHFAEVYGGFRVTLPLVTRGMMQLAQVYPWIFIVGWGVVLLVMIGDAVARATGARGIPWIGLLGHVPLLGAILRANLIARWVDALRLGVESGLDLPRAMELAAAASGEGVLEQEAAALARQVGQGLPISGVYTRRIPATVTAAIELASTSGGGVELPGVLHSLSRMYEQQAEQRLRLLPTILTPILLVVIAGGVSLTIGSMFLPMVKLIQSVSGGEAD